METIPYHADTFVQATDTHFLGGTTCLLLNYPCIYPIKFKYAQIVSNKKFSLYIVQLFHIYANLTTAIYFPFCLESILRIYFTQARD